MIIQSTSFQQYIMERSEIPENLHVSGIPLHSIPETTHNSLTLHIRIKLVDHSSYLELSKHASFINNHFSNFSFQIKEILDIFREVHYSGIGQMHSNHFQNSVTFLKECGMKV